MSISSHEQRFVSVYRAHIDEVYQFVYLRTGLDAALAEDICQDIFLEVLKGLNGFKGLCSERTWVFKIARNRVVDFYRKNRAGKFQAIDVDEQAGQLSDPGQDAAQYVESAFESQSVRDCLATLPEHYRLILLLKYIDGQSVKQIAHTTQRSPKAVESTLQRARQAFIQRYSATSDKGGNQP